MGIRQSVILSARKLRHFVREENGATLPFFGLAVIILVAFLGVAVDTARGYMVRARVHTALDAAALAAGQLIGEPDFKERTEAVFYANFPKDFLGAKVTLNIPDVPDGADRVQLRANAEIGTTLMRVMDFETLDVAAVTEVTVASGTVDIVLAIDMSGSMGFGASGGGTRIAAARNAAKTLVETLLEAAGGDNSDELLQFGIVPWSSSVNITDGTRYDSSQTISNSDGTYKVNNSDVPLRTLPETLPKVTEVPKKFNGRTGWRHGNENRWEGCVKARDGDDADIRLGPVSPNWLGWDPLETTVNMKPNPSSNIVSPVNCVRQPITRLTHDTDKVIEELDKLRSPRGSTNIPVGLAWAWRVLMPGEPFPDADPVAKGQHVRAIVLLTDGQNYVSPSNAHEGRLNKEQMDDRMIELASVIKRDGVRIYVIQFAVTDPNLAAVLKQVGTSDIAPYYSEASDQAGLEAVFKDIGRDLGSGLRLTL